MPNRVPSTIAAKGVTAGITTAVAVAATVAVILLGQSCGDNLFKSDEKKDPPEDATLDLEHNDPTDAINLLTSAVASDPTNYEDWSILALAYAQRAGIEPLEYATKLAQNEGTSGSSSGSTATSVAQVTPGSNFSTEFAALPAATTQSQSDLAEAVTILSTKIPAADRQEPDTFKLAIFQTASFFLSLKALDTNGDGILETDELVSLSDGNATTLLAQLASAQSTFSGTSGDATSAAAAAAIAKYQKQIAAEPGTTSADQLKNFLAANPSAASAASAAASGTGTSTSTGTGAPNLY